MKRYVKKIVSVVDTHIHKKVFTIVAGINGVGKSSMIGVLRTTLDNYGAIIDPDDYAKKYGGSLSGGKEAIKDIEYCIENGYAFTEETTLSGKHIIATAKKAKEHGYTINLIYVGLNSAQDSVDRVANRVKHGGHDIPTDTILRRYNHRFEQLAKILDYCDTAKFYDNSNSYQLVAEYNAISNIFYQTTDDPPIWLSSFLKYIGVD